MIEEELILVGLRGLEVSCPGECAIDSGEMVKEIQRGCVLVVKRNVDEVAREYCIEQDCRERDKEEWQCKAKRSHAAGCMLRLA